MKHLIPLLFIFLLSLTSCNAGTQSKINKSISSTQIIKSINKGKPILIKDMIISDDLDFTQIQNQFVFSSSQRIAEVDVPVTFLKCIFLGKVITTSSNNQTSTTTQFNSNVTFEACDFRGEADFSNSIIHGLVNFTGAIFREHASFNNITIKGRQTYFTAFSSEKSFSMQEAAIGGAIDFFKGHSKGKISFQSSDFSGVAQFSNLVCDGKADFSLATFRSNVLFTYAKFNNEFRMSDSRCDGNCDIVSVIFANKAWVCNTVFNNKCNLSNTEVNESFDLSGTLFVFGKPITDGLKLNTSAKLITSGTRINRGTNFEDNN